MKQEKPQPLDLKEWERKFNGAWDYDVLGGKRQIFISETTFEDLRQRIKSACEFYLRYKDKPELLIKEHPEFFEIIKRIQKNYFDWSYYYNEWLFKLAFKPIFEDGEENEN